MSPAQDCQSEAPSPTMIDRLTGSGRGAVATLAVTGPAAATVVASRFRPRAKSVDVHNLNLNRVIFGDWLLADLLEGQASHTREELVVCRIAEDRFEIHCHGGAVGIELITESLEAAGCVRRPTSEDPCGGGDDAPAADGPVAQDDPSFSLRGATALWQRKTQQALSSALTERAALILLDQFHGALHDELVEILANLEGGEFELAAKKAQRTLEWAPLGMHLTQPWRVTLAGPPNVGKSSLINALVGYERTVVFDRPGTTRDVVSEATAIDGWPVLLSDTAGIRSATDQLERVGVDRAQRELERSDLVVWVTAGDVSDESPHDTVNDCLTVFNKIDLLEVPKHERLHQTIATSAITGAGIDELIRAIAVRLVPTMPPPGTPIPFRQEQVELLVQIVKACSADEPTVHLNSFSAAIEQT